MEELRIVNEGGLIPTLFSDEDGYVVSAREFHEFLGSKRQFANWINEKINRYGLVRVSKFRFRQSVSPVFFRRNDF